MKFGEKYELLESLTTGGVETFVANDKIRGERVLVHIVECAPQRAEQSTADWAMESFRRLAPEPVGAILETGKYSGSLYAYLVTRAPDEKTIKNWVRQYEVQSQDTQENAAAPAANIANSVPAPRESGKVPVLGPGPMTQLLRDFESESKGRGAGVPGKQALPAGTKEPVVSPAPLANLGMPGGSGLHAAPPLDAFNPQRAQKKSIPESVEKDLGPARNVVQNAAPESPMAGEVSRPGEFTSFFQGPFRGDGPSDMPQFSAQPVAAPRKQVGEFTAVFGQMSPPAAEVSEALESNGESPSATSFTGTFREAESDSLFGASSVSKNSAASEPVPAPMKDLAIPAVPVVAGPVIAPPPIAISSTLPIPPIPPIPRPAAITPTPRGGDAATQAFARPVGDPPPMQNEAPAGPSPYTQIISSKKLRAQAENEKKQAGGASLGWGMPEPSKTAGPPMPAPPKVAASATPKMPKAEAPQPPPVSYWPLVLTLTVLLFLAVLLVLYFALRH